MISSRSLLWQFKLKKKFIKISLGGSQNHQGSWRARSTLCLSCVLLRPPHLYVCCTDLFLAQASPISVASPTPTAVQVPSLPPAGAQRLPAMNRCSWLAEARLSTPPSFSGRQRRRASRILRNSVSNQDSKSGGVPQI